MSIKATEQQLSCIAAATRNALLKIEAVSGAGKTSVLRLIADALPVTSIYVAFNKAIATEAAEKFPKHVVCQTTHSLAYREYGAAIQHKLSRPKGAYVNVAGTGSEIARYYRIEGIDGLATASAMGLFVKRTVERFTQSADNTLSLAHVPRWEMKAVLDEQPEVANEVLRLAKRLWTDRINPSSKVLASHDDYLKLYCLSKPVLPYEVVYLDEAADTTPCVLDLILGQSPAAKVVLVGDRRQSIYQFRGAVNAMQNVAAPEAWLTQSFRYGQGIADVASAVLENTVHIIGRADIKCNIGRNTVNRQKPYMYLFRTNSLLLTEAVFAIDNGEKVRVEIDTKDFVKVLQSALALYEGRIKDVKHENITPYTTWKTLKEEAKEVSGELGRLVQIVHGGRAEHIIDILEHYEAPRDAIAIYTTAHRSKGRQCEQVILADDFPSGYKKGEWVGLPEMESNLLYVALTRAERVLEINETVEEIMERFCLVQTEEVMCDC